MNTINPFDPNAGKVDILTAPAADVSFDPVYSTGTGIDFGIGAVNDLVGGALQTWVAVEQIKAKKSLAQAQAYQDAMLHTTPRTNNPGAQPLPPPKAVQKPAGADTTQLLMLAGAGLLLLEALG